MINEGTLQHNCTALIWTLVEMKSKIQCLNIHHFEKYLYLLLISLIFWCRNWWYWLLMQLWMFCCSVYFKMRKHLYHRPRNVTSHFWTKTWPTDFWLSHLLTTSGRDFFVQKPPWFSSQHMAMRLGALRHSPIALQSFSM